MDHERVTWGPADYAGWGRRLAAVLLDGLVALAILAVLAGLPSLLGYAIAGENGAVALGVLGYLASLAAIFAYHIMLIARRGATLGKQWLHVEVRGKDGAYPSTLMAFARFLATQISGMPLYLGYLWALWDEHNRTWHDIICETFVLDSTRLTAAQGVAGGPRMPVHNPLHGSPPPQWGVGAPQPQRVTGPGPAPGVAPSGPSHGAPVPAADPN
ncbi:MAG: RDD family protein, partial [Egibacteraceae bacterium]